MFGFRILVPAAVLLTSAFWFPTSADADCVNPAAKGGVQIYNSTYNVMQYCNGTYWISMGANAIWGLNGTDLHYTAGNVGIGTTAPSAPLEIQTASDPAFRVNHTGTSGNPAIWLAQDGTAEAYIWWNRSNPRLNFGTPTTNPIMTLTNGGNVGIGTAAPSATLHVAATGKRQITTTGGWLDLSSNGGGHGVVGFNMYTDGADGSYKFSNSHGSIGAMGIVLGTDSDWNSIGFVTSGTTTSTAGANFTPMELVTIKRNGNVGIGTTVPSYPLHVSGAFHAEGTNGLISTSAMVAPYTSTGVLLRAEAGTPWVVAKLGTSDASSAFGVANSSNVYSLVARANGNVGIGTTGPRSRLEVSGTILSTSAYNANNNLASYDLGVGSIGAGTSIYSYGKICSQSTFGNCTGGGGTIINGGTITTDSCTGCSDERLKKQIRVLDNSLERIIRLRGVNFEWRPPEDREIAPKLVLRTGKLQTGLIAQDVERVFPELVTENRDFDGIRATDGPEVKTINYNGLMGPIVEAIKELAKRGRDKAAEQDKRLETLEAENKQLR